MKILTDPDLSETNRDLILLDQIEHNPDATQATLAKQLGVAVGTVNWHIKRLVEKGYVKVRRVERRKLRYIITPDGLALRARLTIDFIQSSFRLYRLVRERSLDALQQLEKAGHTCISIDGEGDVADICRLTCLERGFTVLEQTGHAPILRIQGLKVLVEWEEPVS